MSMVLPSANSSPAALSCMAIAVGGLPGVALLALGRSSRMDAASNGAAMMKMTKSTSITSTSGVTLMLLMGWAAWGLEKRPNAMACSRGVRCRPR